MLFDILTKGSYDEVAQVHPISNVLHGHQGSGVLGYASDGAYVNGVAMVSLQLLLFISCRGDCPELPAEIRRSLAAVSVKYTRHQSGSKRCASIWTDTATKASLNRPLDPFMMVGALGSTGARIIAPKSGLSPPSGRISTVARRIAEHPIRIVAFEVRIFDPRARWFSTVARRGTPRQAGLRDNQSGWSRLKSGLPHPCSGAIAYFACGRRPNRQVHR